MECTCDRCVGACKNTPGWFAPGEAEQVAAVLGIPFEEFFKKYLVVDYWVEEEVDTLVLSPVKEEHIKYAGKKAPFTFPFIPSPCVFLKDDRCSIHSHKPKECREVMCDGKDGRLRRMAIRDLWNRPELQKKITGLLNTVEV